MKNGVFTLSVIPPTGCEEGIISIIIKYKNYKDNLENQFVQYYIFELINSNLGNSFRLRKYENGAVKELQIISDNKKIYNFNLNLGFTINLLHKLIVVSNGNILTILLSVNNSRYYKIIEYREMDIDGGFIGVGTSKCQLEIKEIKLRPPKLAFSIEEKKLIKSGMFNGLIIARGRWEDDKFSINQEILSASGINNNINNDINSYNNNNQNLVDSNIYNNKGYSIENIKSNYLGKNNEDNYGYNYKNNNSNLNSNNSFASLNINELFNSINVRKAEFNDIELKNKLEKNIYMKNDKMYLEKNEGNTLERGWDDGGYSFLNKGENEYVKVFGWEKCLENKSFDSRKTYCNNLFLQEQKHKCNQDYCLTCCENSIQETSINILHICLKKCHFINIDHTTDYTSSCINTNNNNTAYSYCDSVFANNSNNENSAKCKLDMCNLCCATLETTTNIEVSYYTEFLCFQSCSLKFNNCKK